LSSSVGHLHVGSHVRKHRMRWHTCSRKRRSSTVHTRTAETIMKTECLEREIGVAHCKQCRKDMEQPEKQRERRPVKERMILTSAIRFYRRFISPILPPACRFYPTCSQYALEALERYGILKGCWLTLKRLSKCHPYHPGGFDPLE